MRCLDDCDTMQCAVRGHVFLPDPPEGFTRLISMAKDGGFAVIGVRQKCRRFGANRIELTGRSEKSGETFLVSNDFSEPGGKHFRYLKST